jgi:hypothetical protein
MEMKREQSTVNTKKKNGDETGTKHCKTRRSMEKKNEQSLIKHKKNREET